MRPRLLLLFALVATSFGLKTAGAKQSAEINQVQDLNEWENLVFEIEDTKCRVGIASVKLYVSSLRPENGYLIGEYKIVVPLMTSKNDMGLIKLPLKDKTVSSIAQKGGTLRGQAISYKNNKSPNSIVCEVLPLENKTILLAITTSERTLEFESRYTVSKSRPADG